jgi:hypothetical protein
MSPQLKISILWVDRQPFMIQRGQRRSKRWRWCLCASEEATGNCEQTTNNKQQTTTHTTTNQDRPSASSIVYVPNSSLLLFIVTKLPSRSTEWFQRSIRGFRSRHPVRSDDDEGDDGKDAEDAIETSGAAQIPPKAPKRD